MSGVYFLHENHLAWDITIFAQFPNYGHVFVKIRVFNQLEGEQALVSFVFPKHPATCKAAQASLLEGAFQLGVSELPLRLEVGTQMLRYPQLQQTQL